MSSPGAVSDQISGPSAWWIGAAALVAVVALGFVIAAVDHQDRSSRPVGEGELFYDDAQAGSEAISKSLTNGEDLSTALRRVRNDLAIESVAAVAEGVVTAATSDSLVGLPLDNPVLASGHEGDRFAAIAAPAGVSIAVDGVAEWAPSDILYQVHQPASDGAPALVLHYDMTELLERRARSTGIRPFTLELLGVAAGLIVVAVLLVVGRSRAKARYRELALESELLRKHTQEVEETNRQLDEARCEAERALELAEETNRIRTEFVLMINHELRTPLASVITGAELLQAADGLSENDKAAILDDMITDGNRLYSMIAQMLTVARIENRGFEFDLQRVPLLDLCTQIEQAHPRLEVDHLGVPLPVLEGVTVNTDPQTVAHLIASLADNALVHGASNVGLECSIELAREPMLVKGTVPAEPVYFTVVDDGPGIDHEFLPRVFEKFEKKSFSPGTGLGLYMAQMMATALDGAIAVHTTEDGTRMTVAVPLHSVSDRVEVPV